MRVIIYSGYSNGLGDLNFGKKLAAEVHAKYPDATIEFVTSSTKKLQLKPKGISDVESFNENNSIPVTPIDTFKESGRKGDIIIVGPVLTMQADEVSALAANKDTPIMLSLEYDFNASWHMDEMVAELKKQEFKNIVQMPTGLGEGKSGIFLNKADTVLDKKNRHQVNAVFHEGLPITGDVIRGGKDPEAYLAQTNITVSYSHDNAERLLSIHREIVTPNKNSDVIIMGEIKLNTKMIEALMTKPSPLDKGFSKIIYERVGEEPKIIGETNLEGPVYRIVHTGRVSSGEAINLRKIGGNFSGATGDQSYSEAISTSNIVVYECQTWKQQLVVGMQDIANKIDPTGQLSRAIHLLAFASSEVEYKELANLIKQEDIQKGFGLYQKEVLATKDLSAAFGTGLEKMVNQVQGEMKKGVEGLKQEKSKKGTPVLSWMKRASTSEPKGKGAEALDHEKSKKDFPILSWMKREKNSEPKKDVVENKGQKFKM